MQAPQSNTHSNHKPSQVQNRRQYTIDGKDMNIYVNSNNQLVLNIRVKVIENYAQKVEIKFKNQQNISTVERSFHESFISKIKKKEPIENKNQSIKEKVSNEIAPIAPPPANKNYNPFALSSQSPGASYQQSANNTVFNNSNPFQQTSTQNSNQNQAFSYRSQSNQSNQGSNPNLNYNPSGGLERPSWASGNLGQNNYTNSTPSTQSFSLSNAFLARANTPTNSIFGQDPQNSNASRRPKQSRKNRKQTVYR